MLFRSALVLSALHPFGVAAMKPSTVARQLQTTDNGLYEIAAPLTHYNNGVDGTGAPPIVDPTIVVSFEHDDVEAVAAGTAYGSVKISHYEGGCTKEIVAPFGGSAIDEWIMDTSGTLTMAQTGLDADITQTITASVQTTIRYQLAFLDANPAITEEILGTVYTKFCTRLSLLDDDGDEFGFREVDISITHTKDSTVDVLLDATEDEDGEDVLEALGDYTVDATFCDISVITPTTAADDIDAPGTGAVPVLNQGDDFTICLAPQRDGADSPDVDIIEVENCVFWVDANPNGLIDNGETSVVAISDGEAVDTVTTDLLIQDGLVAVADDKITGAHFTVTLPPAFFVSGAAQDVNGLCTVLLEFQGAVRRRHLQVVGETAEKEAKMSLKIDNVEAETDESCTAGCFFVFCIFRFIVCFFRGLFGA